MIQSIRLQHFRSYTDDSFEFSPSVNIIVGPNASGKTNLLEAILVMANSNQSYRARDLDLIEFGQPWARIDAVVDSNQRTIKIVDQPKAGKIYELSGRTLKRLTLDHSIPVVLFEPNDQLLMTGPPENRRQHLDELLSQTLTGYSSVLRSYRRSLNQRNRLLKETKVSSEQLFPWNVRLSELGGLIVHARTELFKSINHKIESLYRELARSDVAVAMQYCCPAPLEQYESYMLHFLESRVNNDIATGFTSFGPHREDFAVLFDGHQSQVFASRGETRTFILSLKLIEAEVIKEKRNKKPILLLDDVFSELDGSRRQTLTNHLQTYQTFITTTDADVVVEHFSEQSNIIPITRE